MLLSSCQNQKVVLLSFEILEDQIINSYPKLKIPNTEYVYQHVFSTSIKTHSCYLLRIRVEII